MNIIKSDKEIINTFLMRKKEYSKNKIEVIKNDDVILRKSDINAMQSHNTSFDELLKAYVKNTKRNLLMKLILKVIFFICCMLILIVLFAFLIYSSMYCLKNEVSQNSLITVMVANVISFLTSFIVLPHTIANYLFNNKEDENMTQIIKNIQDYDKNIRDGLNNPK